MDRGCEPLRKEKITFVLVGYNPSNDEDGDETGRV
jgi:hypothetical protein